MPTSRMKKISLAAPRGDMENILRELILLGCVEVCDPEDLPDEPGFSNAVWREVIELEQYNASKERIALLGTQYTFILCGWLTTGSEPGLLARLSEYTCAWEVDELTPDELDLAPAKLSCPGFFRKMRLGGKKLFDPLRAKT